MPKFFIKISFLLSAIFLLGSCKKEYTCTCRDSATGSETVIFTQKTKKGTASSECDDYYNSHYGNTPFNTTSCSLD